MLLDERKEREDDTAEQVAVEAHYTEAQCNPENIPNPVSTVDSRFKTPCFNLVVSRCKTENKICESQCCSPFLRFLDRISVAGRVYDSFIIEPHVASCCTV